VTVAVRVIPCLDVDGGRVVKGVNFRELRDAGDPVELAACYDAEGADELTFLDITASSGGRDTMYDVVRRTAEQVFIPLTVGGGVRSVQDVDRLLRAGADKVSLNTAAVARPELLHEAAQRFGSQCVVLSLDARRAPGPGPAHSGFEVTTHGGRTGTGIDAVQWAQRAVQLGAGEILLNSIDADGTTTGFDLELIRAVRAAVTVPVIASGGAGSLAHFAPAVDAGADAVLAASVFHFGTLRIGQVKNALRGAGHPVRLQSVRLQAIRLQAVRERDLLRGHERGVDLQLNLGVRVQRDVTRVALVDLPVVDGHHVPAGRADLVRGERLAPFVEEVAQGVGALDRGLDVDDAVGGVRVQPVKARAGLDERALRGIGGLSPGDADGGRDLPGRAVHEDGQVRVDVKHRLLGGVAADPVHRLAGGRGGRAGQRRGRRYRYALRADRARCGRGSQVPQRAERGQRQPVPRTPAGDGERDADRRRDDHHDRPGHGEPQPAPPALRLFGPDPRDPLLGASPIGLAHRR
jgi:imidazole glycerol-phosphate synthase subunit HisF